MFSERVIMWTKIVAVGILVLAVLGSYWYTYNAGIRHERQAQIVLLAEANKQATKNFDTIWDLYIDAQGKKKVVFKTIKVEVEKIVDRPVYQNVCLDDEGVELANEALRGKK